MGHRQDLLAAARRLLEEKGYAHITARDLVAASGTNLRSIGYHFGSKAGLLNEAIGEVLEEWCEQLAHIVMADPDVSPPERGLLTWSVLLDGMADKRALLLSYIEALAQAERTPSLREQFTEQYARLRGRVAELVAQSIGNGMRADDRRCVTIASFVIAVCDGLSVQWLLDPAQSPSEADFKAAMELVWSASVTGAQARSGG